MVFAHFEGFLKSLKNHFKMSNITFHILKLSINKVNFEKRS